MNSSVVKFCSVKKTTYITEWGGDHTGRLFLHRVKSSGLTCFSGFPPTEGWSHRGAGGGATRECADHSRAGDGSGPGGGGPHARREAGGRHGDANLLPAALCRTSASLLAGGQSPRIHFYYCNNHSHRQIQAISREGNMVSHCSTL